MKQRRLEFKQEKAIWQAKNKCHNLIIVSPHYDKYVQYSRLAHEIYKKYTPLIEPYGLDECWLDVSGSVELFGSGEEIAARNSRRFKEELGLTVSCGVASNKIFAKRIGYEKTRCNNGNSRRGFQELVWPLPVSDLWGVGRQTTKKLDSYCINTIGTLAKTNLNFCRNDLASQELNYGCTQMAAIHQESPDMGTLHQ